MSAGLQTHEQSVEQLPGTQHLCWVVSGWPTAAAAAVLVVLSVEQLQGTHMVIDISSVHCAAPQHGPSKIYTLVAWPIAAAMHLDVFTTGHALLL